MLEWRYARDPLPLDANGVVSSSVSCRDGDRACDLDTTAGQCTFGVGVCLNVRDPRMPVCTPQQTTRLVFTLPNYVGPNAANQSKLWQLVLAAQLPKSQPDWCGAFAGLVVPAGSSLAVGGAAQGYTPLVSGLATDSDSIRLDCLR
jgi:hypothetical protein